MTDPLSELISRGTLISRYRLEKMTILAAVHFGFALQALRRHFKCPGKKHRERKPDSKEQQQDMEYPSGCGDVVQNDISNFHHQPRHDDVGNGYLEYITTLEFIE